MKNFVGFYTTPSFWAGGEIDIEANKSNLNKVMSQEVFIYETDKYIFKWIF